MKDKKTHPNTFDLMIEYIHGKNPMDYTVGEVGMKCGYCKKWFNNADYEHWNNCRIKYNEQR